MHYLDHAATTPVVPEAKAVLLAFLDGDFGNPSSVHAYGRAARRGVEDAREQVAASIGASPAEITFTAGGTEADNLAIKGVATKLQGNGNHVVTTAFEHHAYHCRPLAHLTSRPTMPPTANATGEILDGLVVGRWPVRGLESQGPPSG